MFFAVAAPWYCLAERATPGFLRYFLVNEHLRRYVTDDYGDQYGAGRVQPYGAIWLMLTAALLPWTVLAIAALLRLFRAAPALPETSGPSGASLLPDAAEKVETATSPRYRRYSVPRTGRCGRRAASSAVST